MDTSKKRSEKVMFTDKIDQLWWILEENLVKVFKSKCAFTVSRKINWKQDAVF